MTDLRVGIPLEDLRRRLDAEMLTPYVRGVSGREQVEIAAAWPQLLNQRRDLGEEALRLAGPHMRRHDD